MLSVHRSVRAALLAAIVLASPTAGFAQGKGGKADGPPPTADPAKIEQAKKHMAAGAALYNDPSGHKCEEAYVEFNKAYSLSGSLNALKNRAVCALELEKDGEALQDYKKVLAGMGDKLAADEKTQIENDLRALELAVAWVTVKADVPNIKIVDVRTPSRGLPITNKYESVATGTKIGFHPGDHAFTAIADDGREIIWKASLSNGSNQEHTFEFTKTAPTATVTTTVTGTGTGTDTAPTASVTATADAPNNRPVPTSVKALAIVTGGLAIGTGVLMGLAGAAKSDYDKQNGTGVDRATLETQRSNVILMNGLADGFLGGTVLAAGATLVLFLIRPTVKAEGEVKTSNFFIAPAVTPAAGGAVVGGKF